MHLALVHSPVTDVLAAVLGCSHEGLICVAQLVVHLCVFCGKCVRKAVVPRGQDAAFK
jgi:hypothetical protein